MLCCDIVTHVQALRKTRRKHGLREESQRGALPESHSALFGMAASGALRELTLGMGPSESVSLWATLLCGPARTPSAPAMMSSSPPRLGHPPASDRRRPDPAPNSAGPVGRGTAAGAAQVDAGQGNLSDAAPRSRRRRELHELHS